ncbi:endoplasmic reticulum membrane sensor NFE2L1 [Carassius gibelio]|uniref:endoplasmic reticulum membrane sensor NFE2L1 n=1 Tax=Carassius gibelio TaxID=101364 RepID=UPI00227766FD|nr:endoplasmic reticulum membrane sensor NFE2L1 [Carassius gibelio]XP_052398698.1 endoplasmic reticulum membrane sensor NFE2L1 [Carassius gibelio]
MPDLKKFLTEGLIQVAILLSLAGMRVDVDPYLPPLSEIILGPNSALTQAQFHNLRNILDGYNLHPKSADLDGFFTARRLLSWVRSLDRLQVPAAELEAWLVHGEPDNGVSIPAQVALLEEGGGLEDVEEPSELSMRLGNGGEVGYDATEDQTLGALGHMSRNLNLPNDDELLKEEGDGMSFFWEQEPQNVHQEQLENARTQPLNMFNEDEEEEDEFMVESWRQTNPFHNQMFEEDLQLSSAREHASLSIEECLHLIDANFHSGGDPELSGPGVQDEGEHALSEFQGPLMSPLLPEQEPTTLEQQWQDVLAIMESQDMDTAETVDQSPFMDTAETIGQSPFNISDPDTNTGSIGNIIQQDVSLHQAALPRSTETQNRTTTSNNHSMPNINLDNSSNVEAFEDSDIIDLFLTAGTSLPSPIDPLLEEAMLDEIGLMDLALVELSQAQSEEINPVDSDSGLSLDYSQSPASPSGSESSSSSSSSSLSSSTPGLMDEEGAVGYTHIKEEDEDVGGYMPGQSKMCQSSFLEARQFHHLPWLEHIGHDHTYNQPQSQKKPPKDLSDESPKNKVLDHISSRDEKHARLMNLPFSNEHIVNLPVDEFNRLLAKYHLNEAQLTLIRDIRRRGKNKMAAQSCRRRKLDVLLGLECSVDSLRRLRAKLLRENSEILRSIREMKQHLNSLYQEVYERLREEQGLLYNDNNFTLQQDSTGHVTSQRRSDSHSRRKLSKRQKHKK